MDYTSLVAPKSTPGSIANWANYGLAPASDVLGDAQALIYTMLRVREMMSDPTRLTLAANATSITLPADFLDPIDVRDSFGAKLPQKDAGSLMNRRSPDATGALAIGTPSVYAILNTKMHFDVASYAADVVQVIYYARPALLSDANPTNFLTDRYPMLLRAAILAAAADFRKHSEDYQRNVQKLSALINPINMENDLFMRGLEVDADYRSL